MVSSAVKKIRSAPARSMETGKEAHADHEQGEQHRRVGQDRPGLAGDQEAQPDAEEGPQQHEVGEVGQVDDVGPQPADERQLQEQHQRASEDQPKHDGPVAIVPGRVLELVLLHRCFRVHPNPAPRRSGPTPGTRGHDHVKWIGPDAPPPDYGGVSGLRYAPLCSRARIFRARDRAVAQLGSAPRSGRGGRRFKSCQPDHCDVTRTFRTAEPIVVSSAVCCLSGWVILPALSTRSRRTRSWVRRRRFWAGHQSEPQCGHSVRHSRRLIIRPEPESRRHGGRVPQTVATSRRAPAQERPVSAAVSR